MKSPSISAVAAICALVLGSSALVADPAKKTPTKAELGAMLKTCSDEADDKGLTVQKGKSEARKTYRRQCMLKNGVAPKSK